MDAVSPLPLTCRKLKDDVETRVAYCTLGGAWGSPGLLPRRHPAYRQHEPDRGASMERVKAHPDTAADGFGGERKDSKRQNP